MRNSRNAPLAARRADLLNPRLMMAEQGKGQFTMAEQPETMRKFLADNDLTVRAEFVPFSQSRKAKPDAKMSERSLNWRVTLRHKGRDILTTDYTAGIAHCPAYKARGPLVRGLTLEEAARLEFETERGRAAGRASYMQGGGFVAGQHIRPDPEDVACSLARDADVLDYPSFEAWAGEFGYDEDSRQAEAIWRACMDIALQLRNGIGPKLLEAMQEAAQDY